MRLIVTRNSGFIGLFKAKRLLERGDPLVVLDAGRLSDGTKQARYGPAIEARQHARLRLGMGRTP